MAEVLTRLGSTPANVANGTSTVFTGTAAHTYTLRGIRIVNNSSAPITIKCGIGGVADANLILAATAIGPGVTFTDDGLLIMTGTETFQANTTATGLTITLNGLDQS